MNNINKDLIIKEVDFNGANLLAVQNIDDSKIYVGVNYILKGFGFGDRQIEYQRNKWNEDKVINKGVQKFSYPSEQRGTQETYCIDIKKLPIALAKINITPKIEKEMPYLAEQLEIYQEQCADVLAKAFLSDDKLEIIEDYLQLDEDERAIIFFQERKQRKELEQQKLQLEEKTKELEPKAKSFEQLISAKNHQSMNQVAKSFKTGRNRLFEFLRNKEILMNNNMPYQQYIESGYFVVREFTVPINGELVNISQILVTGKGIGFVDKLLKEVDYNIDKKENGMALNQAN